MKKLSQKVVLIRRLKTLPVLVIAVVLFAGTTSVSIVRADQFDSQIQALENQNSQTQSTVNTLQSQASSYQDAISKLQQQIAGIQNAIAINQAKQVQLQQQIAQDQQQLDYQKKVLGEDLKAMYVGGQMTTVEMLATSKNLSNFVDAETYSSAVQNKIQSTMQQITTLQNQLEQQQVQVNQLLTIEQQQNQQLNTDQQQQQQLLAYNQSQQATYNQQIQSNQSQIAVLRAQQIAANRKLVGTGHVDFSGSCGGSYPASASGPYGTWGCNFGLDNTIDNWGMYNRECVSYTAWMVYKTYGYMPYWGGNGDANMWPGDARAAGISTGSTPKVNSVAIYMGGASDPWGHAMWVRSVNGDGTITVDQYNLYYDGNFYETTVSAAGLVYIYF
jgi:peptidoglycan hydrolase CwlO-like protein